MRPERKGHRCVSHRPRTVWARVHCHCLWHQHTRTRAKLSVYTEILQSQLTRALHIEGSFPREAWRPRVQDREPLAEVKRPAGGERRGSRLSMGRRKSSSTCLATSMDSSRSNSPSWSRPGSGLAKRGTLRKLVGLMALNPHSPQSAPHKDRSLKRTGPVALWLELPPGWLLGR